MAKNKLPKIENLEITDVSSDGRGVGRVDGRVVFVQKLVPGDVVDVQVIKKRKQYFEAVVEKIHTFSDLRVEPFCSHFGSCGGCKWQNMAYQHQLFYKQKQVKEQLTRIGGLKFPEIRPIIASEKTQEYRNKLEYSFSDKRWMNKSEVESGEIMSNMNGLGYHVPGRFDRVLQIEKCYLQVEPTNKIRNAVHEYAQKFGLTYHNPRLHTGLLRNLMIRITKSGEIMVVLICYEWNEEIEKLLSFIESEFPEINSLQYIVNDKKNDSFFDLDVKLFHGKDYITEVLDGLKFRIGAKSFFQTNTYQAEQLYSHILEMGEFKPDQLVYDLYSGAGSISLYLARYVKHVVGVEIVSEAVDDANVNAKENGIENIDFIVGDMKDVLTPSFVPEHGSPDVIVLDPPRAGLHKDVIVVLQKIAPARIVYVSCNPATQARDLNLLGENWEIVSIQPVDMFPHTHHVENIVVLDKLK